jgi:hypothetical protein
VMVCDGVWCGAVWVCGCVGVWVPGGGRGGGGGGWVGGAPGAGMRHAQGEARGLRSRVVQPSETCKRPTNTGEFEKRGGFLL